MVLQSSQQWLQPAVFLSWWDTHERHQEGFWSWNSNKMQTNPTPCNGRMTATPGYPRCMRKQAHAEDPYWGVWPITQLLNKDGLELLSKMHLNDITLPSDLVTLLEESDEWGTEYSMKIFMIIKQFDQAKLQVLRSKSCETQAVKRAKQAGMVMPIMYTFVPVQMPKSFVSM